MRVHSNRDRAGLGRPADQCASRARCSKGRCQAGPVSQGGPVHAGRPKGGSKQAGPRSPVSQRARRPQGAVTKEPSKPPKAASGGH
jgi:hypothetical protein